MNFSKSPDIYISWHLLLHVVAENKLKVYGILNCTRPFLIIDFEWFPLLFILLQKFKEMFFQIILDFLIFSF